MESRYSKKNTQKKTLICTNLYFNILYSFLYIFWEWCFCSFLWSIAFHGISFCIIKFCYCADDKWKGLSWFSRACGPLTAGSRSPLNESTIESIALDHFTHLKSWENSVFSEETSLCSGDGRQGYRKHRCRISDFWGDFSNVCENQTSLNFNSNDNSLW